MALSADQVLAVLQANGLPVVHVDIGDFSDSTTWVFQVGQGVDQPNIDLDPLRRAKAITAIQALLAPPKPIVSKLNFLKILTSAEYAQLTTKAQTDTTLAYALALLDASFQLSPHEATFQQMLNYAVSVGVFTQARATAIVVAMGG